MIATTISMHPDTLAAITRAAERLNTSQREVIVRLLRRLKENIEDYRGGFTTVSYQRDSPKKKLRSFSIRFSPDDMECLGDMRSFTRCSVSLLVDMAAERYLNEVMQESNVSHHKGGSSGRSTIGDKRPANMT